MNNKGLFDPIIKWGPPLVAVILILWFILRFIYLLFFSMKA